MIPLPNVFLIGPTGTGKTTALRTIVRAGLELHVQFTEPHMSMVLAPHLEWEKELGLPPLDVSKVHYSYIPPTSVDNNVLMEAYELQRTWPWEQLKKQTDDPMKAHYVSFQRMAASLLVNWHCDQCSVDFGPVTSWGHERALVVDGLSGVNDMAEQHIGGGAMARSQSQMGAMMDTELNLFGKKLPMDTNCLYVLIGHLRRIYSDMSQGMTKLPHALGKANAADWPRLFQDSILAVRVGNEFMWSTSDSEFDCAARNLPIAPNLAPDFQPLLRTWYAQTQQQPGNPPGT